MNLSWHQRLMAQNQLNNLKDNESIALPLIGIDEVGRGCIAGPVCAGVVFFKDPSHSHNVAYKDSKLLSEDKREFYYNDIINNHYWGLGWASVEEIDQINIRQAALLAMSRAYVDMTERYSDIDFSNFELAVDGRDTVPQLGHLKQQSVIKGDQKVKQISAASIVAKVSRDRLMKQLAETFVEYKFDQHKGYGTKDHQYAIKTFGVTPHHRKTFGGVKEYI